MRRDLYRSSRLQHLVGQAMLAAACAAGLPLAAQTAAAPGAPASSPPPPPPQPPCAVPAFAQMDFWLGQWQVRWDASPGLPAGSGRNTITRSHGGCVIQEAFVGGPSTGGLVGHSISTFHAASGRWRQTWVDNQGGYFALAGGPQGPRFVLQAERPTEASPWLRMVFEDMTARSLVWRWQRSTDAGDTWADRWVIHYQRELPTESAQTMADRLLQAVGGRERWAALTNTVNDSQQFRTSSPEEVRAVITMDFLQPRWRIDTTAPGLQLTRVIDGERDWRRTREGAIVPLSPASRAEDLQWYAGHVYRTLSRLARRDPRLTLRVGDDGRLEVLEAGAEPAAATAVAASARRIAWFKLDSRGEPYAFGGVGDGPGTVSGPWKVSERGIQHPTWTAWPDGSWRASLNQLRINVPLDDSLFARPP